MTAPIYFYIIETYSRPRISFISGQAREFGGQDFEVRRCTESALVKDITDGQIEDVQKVLEVCDELGTCRDVTEDVANEVTQEIYRRGAEWPVHLEEFLKLANGATNSVERSPVVTALSTQVELVP